MKLIKAPKKYVASARIIHDCPSLVVLEIDFHLKYPGIVSTGCLCMGHNYPDLTFESSKHSILNGKPVKGVVGTITFPAYTDWDIYAAAVVDRYSIAVILRNFNT